MTSTKIGRLFTLAYTEPLSTTGASQPGAQMYFYVGGSYEPTQQTVYADIGLTTPLSQPVTADANGRFVPVFLNPALLYSWQLFYPAGSGSPAQEALFINAQNINIPATAVVATTTTRNEGALAADPYLTYPIPAAGFYRVELDVVMDAQVGGLTPGVQFRMNFSGTANPSAANTFAMAGVLDNTPVAAVQASFALNATVGSVALSTLPENAVRIAGTIQVSTAGTLAFEWAQAVSSADTISVLKGSTMTVTRIG